MKKGKYGSSTTASGNAQETMPTSGGGAATRAESVIRANRIATSAVLVALAMIFSYIEAIIPFNFGVPGVKLGLSNLVVIIALFMLGASFALSINVIRIVLSGFLFGGVFGILYSMSGGLLSLLIMVILKKTGKFSIVGVSMAGGVFHNVGQIIVAALIVENVKMMLYLPVLLISGMLTGILIGIVAYKVLGLAGGKRKDFLI